MVKVLLYAMMLDPTGCELAPPPEKPRIEARKRGKKQRGRRRGGSGLR
tara:strand:- start:69 stop:212 length:144 start_codon:yes stop_codon:yes gene_type:complete